VTAEATRARYVTHAVRHTRPGPAMLADYLAGFKARGQGAWPSQRHMATRFGVTTRTIHRWTTRLEADGLLHVERATPRHDHITGRWKRRTNRYRCTFNKTKRGRMTGKDQFTPSGHFCPHDVLYEEPCSGPVPPEVGVPPPEPATETEPVVGPPWIRLGITRYQWKQMMEEEEQ
jgi:hypothetical protein